MEGMGMNGSMFRIKQCAKDLVAMEEDFLNWEGEIVDDASWDLMGSSLRLKSTFLFLDLNGVISGICDRGAKESLTLLANELLLFMDELCCAARSRDRPSMQKCYSEAIGILAEVSCAFPPLSTTH